MHYLPPRRLGGPALALAVASSAALSAAACSPDERGSVPAAVAAPGPATAAAAPAPRPDQVAAAAPAPAPSGAVTTLAGQLAYEAAHRAGGQRVEAAFSALAAAGLRLPAPRQYLAAVVGARYCAGGITDDGLAISACEYDSAAAAASGLARAARRFPQLVGTRAVVQHDALSLALSSGGRPPAAATVTRVRAALAERSVAQR